MEQWIGALFLVFFTLEFLIEFVLNELNLRHVRARNGQDRLPHAFRDEFSREEYNRTVDYTLAKGVFQRWSEIYGRAVILILLFGGCLPLFDAWARTLGTYLPLGTHGHGILFVSMVALYFTIAGLPTGLYATFVLEAQFGFNKMSFGLYIADKLKGLALGFALGLPFVWTILWLMRVTGPFWWVWAFLFVAAFQLSMMVIFPRFIAPWFNKFEPLQEGEFRRRILALADQVGFEASEIFSMDGSKRSAHSNAYFTGLGKSKRIVLFDTLIEQMSIEQGLAVLAHEMGHYKMKHIRRMLFLQTTILLVGFYILSLLLDYLPLYAAFGLKPSHHGGLVLFAVLAGPFTFFLGPLLNLLSRKHEYEADCFAVTTLRDPKPMEEALVKLTVKNLTNLTPHPWYSAYHYSHPSPAERIAALGKCASGA